MDFLGSDELKGAKQDMGKGFLEVEAQIGFGALPVSGANVEVQDIEGNILYELKTDEDGKTEQISLDAVDREKTLDPDYMEPPYTVYDLVVKAEGYETVYINGVHIFDGETAIQPVIMIPQISRTGTPTQQTVDIGIHGVEMTEERHQVGPYLDPRVMRHVIIPDRITVHLGTPASSAQNVQVPFPDYVKNVASREIYSTWPDASLRANIYAIITFALNRIFTEWYRSQGYNFDITNSTAYDQYYVASGTIYESISRIVDEIFNQYVVRDGHNAPFFTSFCNGTTAKCSGLSQWGSVDLANAGMSPIEILRYYYPNDVVIGESNTFASVVESYPGKALRQGDTGLDVQTIQNQLNRIRRNYPLIPVIPEENGVFDSYTLASVRTFQQVFNLTADGIVGRATWYRISYIYAAIARLSELDSEGIVIGIGTVPPGSVLSQGASGNDVITLQYLLSFISEFYPTIPEPIQNGIFGADTNQSVLAFQRMVGMPVDGVVGPGTWDALYDTYWGIKNNVDIPEMPDVIEYVVKAGDTLSQLAQQFDTTVEAIRQLNGLTGDVIYVGQMLLIPLAETEVPEFIYVVQSGDTLFLLAQRFGTTVDAIKDLNNLQSDMLVIGQILKIPEPEPVEPTFSYTVQSGDTLFLLAQRFQTTVDRIKDANGLTGDQLSVGQVLQIPGAAIPYTVQSGDSLYLLAQRFNTTVDQIRELNGLADTNIYIGQVLLIPQ